jgi:threonine synthase
MTTVIADNVYNLAVEGTFDDCQKLVKDMFADETFRSAVNLSAVNSINWARIMAQIVYYVTGALALGAPEREVSFSVPTGNFGNIFAAYAAKQMGVPIKKLAIATNRNDILTRFFETGKMERGSVEPSFSPSMDIQISSNFERYLFLLLGRDPAKLREVMQQFADSGSMALGDNLIEHARGDFSASRCSDEETLDIIRSVFENTAEIMDPHSAVGLSAAQRVLADDPETPMINLACAHAAKFPDAVEKAMGQRPPLPERMADLYDRPEELTALANELSEVQNFVRSHARVVQKSAA